MSMPRVAKKPASPETIPLWSRHTTSIEYGSMSVRGVRGSVRFRWMLRLEVSASRLSSVSSFASACQLPDTSSSIANSVPRLAMRLSLMLPPDSLMTRVSSWTMRVRSLPMAETARCCFICRWRLGMPAFARGSVPGAGAGCEPRRGAAALRAACLSPTSARNIPRFPAGHHCEHRSQRMFAGSLVAIVSPMRADGAIDFEAWARLLDFHVANATDGIVVGGTTGESATLRDGQLLVTPAYNRPPQEGLYGHFAAAAAAARKPLLLYNVPARTAVDMQPATVARLARLKGIVGIKEAVPDPARVRELVALCPPDFVVLSGDDATARASIAAGARGVISVTANVAPRAMSQMLAAARGGDAARAAELDAPLSALHRELFVEANPIPVKWLLAQLGLIGPGIRLPLMPLAGEHHARLLAAARSAGVLA